MSKYLMGLDFGGGGGRCLLANSETGETFYTLRPWTLPVEPESGGFAYTFDPEKIWRAFGEVTRQIFVETGISPNDVAGIAATSMRHSTVLIDKKGKVLLAAPNRDARASEQGVRLAAQKGDEIYKITGHGAGPIYTATRLMWFRETMPDAYKAVHSAMSIGDWLGYLFSGETAYEYSQAGDSLLLDLKTRRWSSGLVKFMELSEKSLPALRQAGSRLGRLTREAAENLGLPPGIPVAVGCPDTQGGLLGSGVVAPGQIGVVAGTTTPIQMVIPEPLIDNQMRTWTGLHSLPGLYVLESNAGQMGSSLDWIARLLFGEAFNPVARLAASAETSEPGGHGFRSSVGAGVFNASALELPVDTLTFSALIAPPGDPGRADMARAILEGMAYAIRANVEQLLGITGKKLTEITLTGGLSRSSFWAGMVANVLGCPVHVGAMNESSALGAVICAGVGAGLFPDLVAGVQHFSRSTHVYEPGLNSIRYQSLYADWQSLREERRPADIAASSQLTETLLSGQTYSEKSSPATRFRPKIYISAEVGKDALAHLGEIGQVTYKPYRLEGILLTGDDLVQTLQGYQIFVTEVDIVDAEALIRLPDLRMIIVCRGNPVNIDIPACTAANVPVVNTPSRNADAVADLTLGFLLMQARKLQPAAAFLHQAGSEAGDLGRMGQAHEEFLGVELWRKVIGVVGGGAIGRKVVQRLLPFGARILVYDPFLSDGEISLMGAEKASFAELLAKSDFITLHAAVTENTRGILNAEAFSQMKKSAFLVNTARAALVDQQALLNSLASGRLAGYASDVFPVEPPAADDPLLSFPNVIATPHVGGNTLEVAEHQGEIIAAEINAMLSGKPPRNILNPVSLEEFSWDKPRRANELELKRLASSPGPGATDLDVSTKMQQKPEQETQASAVAVAERHSILTSDKETNMDNSETRKKMVEILREFTAGIPRDKEMENFSKGKNVTFLFTVKDMDQSFFMSFLDGKVSAGLETPSQEPNVKLKMSADILDGIFTGRVNATKAATSGKLSFSGDTGKAMSFLRIQGNMTRIYSDARKKVGDPGDLTKLGAVMPGPDFQPAPPREKTVPAGQPPMIGAQQFQAAVKVGDVRDQILQVTNELYAKGLITPTGGNVSARCDDNPNEIWITPSGIFKGDLRPEMMVRIDLDGKVISETDYSASSERKVHSAIYKANPETNAVIHTHAPAATLMALTGTPFLPISTEAAFLGDIPVVPFIMPGTDELAEIVQKAMGDGFTCLMQNHGLVVAGSNLRRAADMTDVVEVTAHKLLVCRQLGVNPPVLPEEIVRQLKEVGAMAA